MPDESWRFEKIARSALRMILSEGYSKDLKKHQLLHIMDLAFRRGLDEGMRIGGEGAIPITDLTHIPEIIAHAGHRWEKGKCH